jgi:hypothetical protein
MTIPALLGARGLRGARGALGAFGAFACLGALNCLGILGAFGELACLGLLKRKPLARPLLREMRLRVRRDPELLRGGGAGGSPSGHSVKPT